MSVLSTRPSQNPLGQTAPRLRSLWIMACYPQQPGVVRDAGFLPVDPEAKAEGNPIPASSGWDDEAMCVADHHR